MAIQDSPERLGRAVVVIATKGRPQAIGRLLQVLEQQTQPPAAVVVSATEQADVDAIPASWMNVDVIFGSPGTSIQRNRALNRLQDSCDVVFFFDDDFVPSPHWIERTVRVFASHPGVAGVSGRVIRDGAMSDAVSWEEAEHLIREADAAETDGADGCEPLFEAPDLYGCNMAYRMSAVGSELRFDERLALYGWLEDKDFSRLAGRAGRLVQCHSLVGVHLGLKQGRVSGEKFGYAQIVNPWYLCRKGTLSAKEAWSNTLKALAINGIKTIRPEAFIDRRGRFRGNVVALRHLLSGVCRPENAAEL
ncbi:MAG TPA: glycosyltransferase [Steroidobacteraceae bacterium]|jgi:GT2 family glycosyltransferase|nr:glycosyltransferase [Steroidobacteraceae bacterium]